MIPSESKEKWRETMTLTTVSDLHGKKVLVPEKKIQVPAKKFVDERYIPPIVNAPGS
jgi:hypothetical protein